MREEYIIKTEEKFLLEVYSKRPVAIVEGKGAIVKSESGKEYIDCIGGWGATNIGHSNESLIKAINEQAKKLISCPSILYNNIRAKTAAKLVEISPDGLDKVFFTNSGTESIEAALKFAILSTGKTEIISAMKGFHGRTLGALSVTHKKKYREDFLAFLNPKNIHFVPFNKYDKLKEKINSDIAAIILEIVQGEGGVNIGDKTYFQQVRELCDQHGIILIIDEVQTGFGRTGKLFACEWMELNPDIICLAKSIAGGLPMGAVIVNNKIKSARGKHGSTFGGNPLASAACLATIEFIEENNLTEQSKEKGEYFLSQLVSQIGNHEKIRNIRGLGLMIAIELKEDNQFYIKNLMENGILCIPTGKTILRFLPPLVITYEEINQIISILVKVINLKAI